MNNVIITGGAGFIGSHLLQHLLIRDNVESILVFDNFSSGTQRQLNHIPKSNRWRVIEGDLKDLNLLNRSMHGMDTVIHLAANPDIAKAITRPDIDFWEGTYLLQNVLEAMRLNNVNRIFYTSGSGVYGEDASIAFNENHGPCLPISTYGASKLGCEALICAYSHMFNIFARIFRFANVVGPRQTHGVGYDFVRNLRRDPTRLRIFGDGSQTKSYIHIDDVINAIFLADKLRNSCYEVYNVATDDYVSVTQIANIAIEVCNLSRDKVFLEFTGGDRGWKGDVPVVHFDCSKIKFLGWNYRRDSRTALFDSMKAMKEEIIYV